MDRIINFVQEHEEFLYHPETISYVHYEGDVPFQKTKFSYSPQVEDTQGITNKEVRKTVRKTKLKFRAGDNVIARRTPSGRLEVIPGNGIVLSNLCGEDWDAETVGYILEQDSVKAISWENQLSGLQEILYADPSEQAS